MQHPEEGTIHAWLDGELGASEGASLEAHVAGCAACAALVAEARGLTAASSRILGALDEVPSGVVPASQAPTWSKPTRVETTPALGVHRTVSAEHPSPRRRRRLFNTQYAAAAAVVVMAVGTWTVVRRSPEAASTITPMAETTVSPMLAESASAAIAAPRPTAPADEAPPRARAEGKTLSAPALARRPAPAAPSAAGAAVAQDRAEPDAIARRDAAANVVPARQALEQDAAFRKERVDTVRAAPPAAAAKRFASTADSITSNEASRVRGDLKAQAAISRLDAVSATTGQAAERRSVAGVALDQRLGQGSVCYAIDRTPRAVQMNVPPRIELRPDDGPKVGDRAFKIVRVPGAIPDAGTWYWIQVPDGTLYLAQVDVAPPVVRQLVAMVSSPDATSGVRGTMVPCEVR